VTRPIAVEIIQPKRKLRWYFSNLIGEIGGVFGAAYLVMLLAPPSLNWHPSYWHSVAFYYLARVVLDKTSTYKYWTRGADEKR
jgi:hypothetical protein